MYKNVSFIPNIRILTVTQCYLPPDFMIMIISAIITE